MADVRVPHSRSEAVLRGHLFSARRPLWAARVPLHSWAACEIVARGSRADYGIERQCVGATEAIRARGGRDEHHSGSAYFGLRLFPIPAFVRFEARRVR